MGHQDIFPRRSICEAFQIRHLAALPDGRESDHESRDRLTAVGSRTPMRNRGIGPGSDSPAIAAALDEAVGAIAAERRFRDGSGIVQIA